MYSACCSGSQWWAYVAGASGSGAGRAPSRPWLDARSKCSLRRDSWFVRSMLPRWWMSLGGYRASWISEYSICERRKGESARGSRGRKGASERRTHCERLGLAARYDVLRSVGVDPAQPHGHVELGEAAQAWRVLESGLLLRLDRVGLRRGGDGDGGGDGVRAGSSRDGDGWRDGLIEGRDGGWGCGGGERYGRREVRVEGEGNRSCCGGRTCGKSLESARELMLGARRAPHLS